MKVPVSRRPQLLITTATLLLLIGIPVGYVAFTWHVADPFRFRYVGHGEAERQPINPSNPDEPKVFIVPIFIELQNTKNLPIIFIHGEVRGERDSGGPPCAVLEWKEGPIPSGGTVRLVTYVSLEDIKHLESESLDVLYKTVSDTQWTASDLVWWLRENLYTLTHIDIGTLVIEPDKSVTPLLRDQAHP